MHELTGVSQICWAGSVQMDAVLGCCRPRGPDGVLCTVSVSQHPEVSLRRCQTGWSRSGMRKLRPGAKCGPLRFLIRPAELKEFISRFPRHVDLCLVRRITPRLSFPLRPLRPSVKKSGPPSIHSSILFYLSGVGAGVADPRKRQILCHSDFVHFQLLLKHMFSTYSMIYFFSYKVGSQYTPSAPGLVPLWNFRTHCGLWVKRLPTWSRCTSTRKYDKRVIRLFQLILDMYGVISSGFNVLFSGARFTCGSHIADMPLMHMVDFTSSNRSNDASLQTASFWIRAAFHPGRNSTCIVFSFKLRLSGIGIETHDCSFAARALLWRN